MYWPIGAPRVYATAEHETTRRSSVELEEEEEVTSTVSRPDERRNGKEGFAEPGREQRSELSSPSPETAVKSEDPASQNSIKGDRRNDGELKGTQKGNGTALLGLQVARHGHLFATITSNSLTIWQTQVWSFVT